MQGNILAYQSMGRDLEFLERVVLLGVIGSPLQTRDFDQFVAVIPAPDCSRKLFSVFRKSSLVCSNDVVWVEE